MNYPVREHLKSPKALPSSSATLSLRQLGQLGPVKPRGASHLADGETTLFDGRKDFEKYRAVFGMYTSGVYGFRVYGV